MAQDDDIIMNIVTIAPHHHLNYQAALAYTIASDPVPRGLLTLCPWASSGPQGLYTAYTQHPAPSTQHQ